jgi:hypothetical protein
MFFFEGESDINNEVLDEMIKELTDKSQSMQRLKGHGKHDIDYGPFLKMLGVDGQKALRRMSSFAH